MKPEIRVIRRSDSELTHYGVPGMKWGTRARSATRSAVRVTRNAVAATKKGIQTARNSDALRRGVAGTKKAYQTTKRAAGKTRDAIKKTYNKYKQGRELSKAIDEASPVRRSLNTTNSDVRNRLKSMQSKTVNPNNNQSLKSALNSIKYGGKPIHDSPLTSSAKNTYNAGRFAKSLARRDLNSPANAAKMISRHTNNSIDSLLPKNKSFTTSQLKSGERLARNMLLDDRTNMRKKQYTQNLGSVRSFYKQ